METSPDTEQLFTEAQMFLVQRGFEPVNLVKKAGDKSAGSWWKEKGKVFAVDDLGVLWVNPDDTIELPNWPGFAPV